MLDLAPEQGWRRIDLLSKMTVPVQELSLTVVMDDGSSPEVAPPDDLNVILAKLRMLLHTPERGAWFSARITINAPATIDFHYNYDFEPRWNPPIDPACYVEDLEMFPRDRHTTPEWLLDRIAEAGKEPH
ncbi:hypothetical protein GCM10010470_60460 [Saccharopolyspora taberi]|uniref:Uncharacterized protein n=2 Tax=Saccharopolyspora taberi TaxID=60895 RepID=A0ABN3VLH2_9PSEU